MVLAKIIATIILTIMPGIKGKSPKANDFPHAIFKTSLSHTTPMPNTIKLPIIIAARSFMSEGLPFPDINPIAKTATKKPNKKPPVGPNRTANPAFPPAKTGSPSAPNERNNPTLALPQYAPRNKPASMAKKSDNTMGTGLNGIGKLIYPPIIVNAVKREAKTVMRILSD